MLGASRMVQLQAKAAGPSTVRLQHRHAARVQRRLTNRRLVTVAAAESDAAPVAQKAAPAKPLRPLSSLQENEIVEGRVVAIQSYGAFVDIGSEAQGLIHVSQLADGYVKNVADVIKMGDVVKVKVLSVDVPGRRVALSRRGLAPRPAAAAAEEVEDALVVADEAEAVDPNSAQVDGLTFVVEDDDDDGELDVNEVELEEDISPEAAREIAIACEDLVNGTVKAVDANGVTVSYTLSDGTPVEGVIAVSELLAPAMLVSGGEEGAAEGDEYVEVDDINPAQYYKVGDAISCAVYDVEEGGVPLLTQRLYEADDELAELAEEMDKFEDVDQMSDALLIQGLWAAEEAYDEDEEGPAENADSMMEELAPLEGAPAAAAAAFGEGGEEVEVVRSASPDDLRSEVLVARGVAATSPVNLLGSQGLNLPNRALNLDPSAQVVGALFDEYGNNAIDYDDPDEDELIGVAVADNSYIPRGLLKKLGVKIVKDEETGEWEAKEREGAEVELTPALAAELEAVAAGTAMDPRDIDAIVADILSADDDLEEDELPVFARRSTEISRPSRRSPVVAAAAVSGAQQLQQQSQQQQQRGQQ